MKYLLVLVVGLVSGYFIYPAFNSKTLSPEKTVKFQNFINEEAKAFALLEDADAKLKAAEAMYGKMMILFLADLGLKTSYQYTPAVPDQLVMEKTVEDVIPVDQVVNEKTLVTTAEKTKDKKNEEKKTDQQRYDLYRSAQYMEAFKGKDKRLLGSFKGLLRYQSLKNRDRIDSVQMNFNLRQEGNTVTGDTLVVMSDPENVEYSRNVGNGGNKSLKSVPQNADAFYVEASPTSYFFINLKAFPSVSGQYFERGKLIGNVTLQKTDGP